MRRPSLPEVAHWQERRAGPARPLLLVHRVCAPVPSALLLLPQRDSATDRFARASGSAWNSTTRPGAEVCSTGIQESLARISASEYGRRARACARRTTPGNLAPPAGTRAKRRARARQGLTHAAVARKRHRGVHDNLGRDAPQPRLLARRRMFRPTAGRRSPRTSRSRSDRRIRGSTSAPSGLITATKPLLSVAGPAPATTK